MAEGISLLLKALHATKTVGSEWDNIRAAVFSTTILIAAIIMLATLVIVVLCALSQAGRSVSQLN